MLHGRPVARGSKTNFVHFEFVEKKKEILGLVFNIGAIITS